MSQSFYQKYFCDVASHIWNATCQESRRKKFLEIKYPKICDIIAPFSEYFDGKASCEKWPKNYFAKYRYVQNIGSHFEKVFNSVKNLSFWNMNLLYFNLKHVPGFLPGFLNPDSGFFGFFRISEIFHFLTVILVKYIFLSLNFSRIFPGCFPRIVFWIFPGFFFCFFSFFLFFQCSSFWIIIWNNMICFFSKLFSVYSCSFMSFIFCVFYQFLFRSILNILSRSET